MSKFTDKFDTNEDPLYTANCWKLTATGCMERHNLTRDAMMLTRKETKKANWELPNRAEWEEKRLLNTVASLFKQGYRLRKEETLEEFVTRCYEFNNQLV